MRSNPWMAAKVIRCHPLTSSCLIVRVKPRECLTNLVAGQTMNIALQAPGEGRRVSSFTILSAQPCGEFSLLVRATGGGGVSDGLRSSSDMNDLIWVSDSIPTVSLPRSRGGKPILCLVAGSGASILGGLAENQSLSDAEVVFVGRAEDCVAIPDAVDQHLVESDRNAAPRRWTIWNSTDRGRPQEADIKRLIGDERRYSAIVACGPEGFCELVRHVGADLGIDSQRLIIESFGAGVDSRVRVSGSTESVAVVDLFGESHAVRWPENENLVSAMLNAGLEVPYSCRAGICSTCQCSVLIGDTEMQVDLGLSDDEKSTGLALACQLRPVSQALAVRFTSGAR